MKPQLVSNLSSSTPATGVKRAGSENPNPAEAAREIHAGLAQDSPACIIFYCSADYCLELLSQELEKLFSGIQLIGCTTAGEITPLGCRVNSISAFSLSSAQFAVEAKLIENLASFTADEAEILVSDMVQRLKNHAVAPIAGHSFALSLLDGMSIREELVLNALSSGLQEIPLVGGSAGDNQHFVDTQIYFNGTFQAKSAVLVLVNTICPFEVFSSHHLIPQTDKLVVTRASPYERVVHEFNAEPAALEYCRINGLAIEDLTAETFGVCPLAVQLSDELYARSIQKVNDDLSLTFFCAIDVGVILTSMRSSGLVAHTKELLSRITEKIGSPQVIIGYDCIHRRCEIDRLNLVDAMSELYARYNVIGFNTYGEQSNGMHLNHTLTGVAIGSVDDGQR